MRPAHCRDCTVVSPCEGGSTGNGAGAGSENPATSKSAETAPCGPKEKRRSVRQSLQRVLGFRETSTDDRTSTPVLVVLAGHSREDCCCCLEDRGVAPSCAPNCLERHGLGARWRPTGDVSQHERQLVLTKPAGESCRMLDASHRCGGHSSGRATIPFWRSITIRAGVGSRVVRGIDRSAG